MDKVEHSGMALLEAGFLPMAPGPYFASRVVPEHNHTLEEAASRMELDADFLKEFVHDKVNIDLQMAERLARYAETSQQFWLSLQAAWDYAKSVVPPHERHRFIRVSFEAPYLVAEEGM